MSAVQWFSGPPPAVGWWPSSIGSNLDLYRWWNGSFWSSAATSGDENSKVVAAAMNRCWLRQGAIKWRHWSIEIDGTDGKGAHL